MRQRDGEGDGMGGERKCERVGCEKAAAPKGRWCSRACRAKDWREQHGVAKAEVKLALFVGNLVAMQREGRAWDLASALEEAARRAGLPLLVGELGYQVPAGTVSRGTAERAAA